MELVYLWVEEYKNIKKQGFNFSPRFECEFKDEYDDGKLKDNCELEINPKKYTSIFPKNINITAIVGSNGTGKSNILEIVARIIDNEIEDLLYLILFYIDNEIEYLSNINIDYELQKSKLENKFFIYNSNNITNGYFDDKLEYFASKNYSTFKESNIRNQSIRNLLLNSNRVLESYSLDGLAYRHQHSLYIDEINDTFNNSKLLMQFDFIEKFGEIFFPFLFPNFVEVKIQNNKNTSRVNNYSFYRNIANAIINYHNLKRHSSSNFDEYKHKFTNEEKDFLRLLSKYYNVKNHESINLSFEDAKLLINKYSQLKIKLLDLKWYGLSSGQESLLNLFTLSLHGVESFRSRDIKEDIFIMLSFDEIENNLHPKWQKSLMNTIITFFNYLQQHYKENFNYNLHLQLLNATHSPYILSDLPKENVIFLDKYKKVDKEVKNDLQKKGNCKNVSGSIEIKQTFGANIHTLLSHGFFISNGLMGEFAKGKIQEIKNFYELIEKLKDRIEGNERSKRIAKKSFEKKKRFKHIQSIIGEPFLQTVIKNYLDELEQIFDKEVFKKSKIDSLISQFGGKDELKKYLDGIDD